MLREHPFFRELIMLGLPADGYVIAGSGAMFAHGLRKEIGDVDVVAGRIVWGMALKLGQPEPAPLGYVQRIVLFGGAIEVLDGWFGHPVDSLILEAETIEGINFMPLKRVLEWKIRFREGGMDRKKDARDIELLEEYLR
ncbi:hypothetical protein ACF08M_28395 [Streptomyces sp. NPDC015032]|uniref:hypothetical protein n=1 Tax=Streptomyces sp. NPDC015032 TaxID=3364937 RepID=UPI0036FB119C